MNANQNQSSPSSVVESERYLFGNRTADSVMGKSQYGQKTFTASEAEAQATIYRQANRRDLYKFVLVACGPVVKDDSDVNL